MHPLTSEWVEKAEGDVRTANREMASGDPNCDAACFHAQQCAEKYLKARLVEAHLAFPKTHDLETLLRLVIVVEPAWESLRSDLIWLTDSAVEVRYPGYSAGLAEAERAVAIAASLRRCARTSLGVET